MPTVYRYSLCVVLMSCLLASGCRTAKELGKSLGDLEKVRAELIKKFGEEGVNLHINTGPRSSTISVLYANSPLNQKSTEERAKRAQETAEIVKQHYSSIKSVSEIWVVFLRVTTRLVVFHWSEMIDAHGFDNEARALSDPSNASFDPGQPVVRYSPRENKTEIASSGIQLEGTGEKGVMVVPHFSVAGDANKVRPKPPDEVGLDFAAFSEKPKFPNVTKLVFFSDNKVVYLTEGQFSTSKIAEDMYSEFLYLKIPTAAFLEITSGSTIKIKLNKREYTLTESQVQELQRMSDYMKVK